MNEFNLVEWMFRDLSRDIPANDNEDNHATD